MPSEPSVGMSARSAACESERRPSVASATTDDQLLHDAANRAILRASQQQAAGIVEHATLYASARRVPFERALRRLETTRSALPGGAAGGRCASSETRAGAGAARALRRRRGRGAACNRQIPRRPDSRRTRPRRQQYAAAAPTERQRLDLSRSLFCSARISLSRRATRRPAREFLIFANRMDASVP